MENNQFTRIGTFCEKCRNVICNCNEHKEQMEKITKEYKETLIADEKELEKYWSIVSDKDPNKPEKYKNMELKKAIEVLCNALMEDNSVLYDLWYKELRLSLLQQVWDKRLSPEFREPYDFEQLADGVAKNFLNLLISK